MRALRWVLSELALKIFYQVDLFSVCLFDRHVSFVYMDREIKYVRNRSQPTL